MARPINALVVEPPDIHRMNDEIQRLGLIDLDIISMSVTEFQIIVWFFDSRMEKAIRELAKSEGNDA